MVDKANIGVAAGAAAQPTPPDSSLPPAPAEVAGGTPQPPAPPVTLRSIRKVFIDKMPNDLDQYLRAEIAKQFKGSLTVVLDRNCLLYTSRCV